MEFLRSSCFRNHAVAVLDPLAARGFAPAHKIDGRYYGFPSTDKQNIDLNVNVREISTGCPLVEKWTSR